MSSVKDAITKRSSTRGYEKEPLTPDEIRALIEAGLKAPTATNRQEIHFTVVPGDAQILTEIEEEKNRMREIQDAPHNFYYEAPVVILISAEESFRWSQVDAGIAVENMALIAEELGLGNLIIGCIHDAMHGDKRKYFEQALQIPEGYEFEIALAVGHKKVSKTPHEYEEDKQVTYL